MKAFVNVAPALPELAIMGKATSGPRKHGPALPYDCIVMDCYATGHFMALMGAADGMAEAVKIGPMGEQSRGISKTLRDSKICQYYLVCLPEELPVRESEELYEELKKQYGIQAKIVLNKYLEGEIPVSDYTSAQKSASEEFREFSKEDQQNREVHHAMKERLEKLNSHVKIMPTVWEHDVFKLLETLAKRI